MGQVTNTCYGTYGGHYTLYLDYNLNSQNIGANTSNITLHMYARSDSSSYKAYNLYETNPVSLNVNGGIVFSRNQAMDFRNQAWVDMGSWSGDVGHNSDGNLYITVGGSFSINGTSSLSGGDVSTGWTLPQIPRYANFTSHYIDTTGLTSITVRWSTDSVRDWTQYSLNGGGWTNAGDSVSSDNRSGTYTIGGLNPNTNYNIRTRIKRADSQLWTESGIISGTTKDIAKFTNISNMIFGNSVNIQFSNPSNSQINLIIKKDNTEILRRENILSQYILNLSQSELDYLYKKITNNQSTNLKFILQTRGTWNNEQTILCSFKGNQKTIYFRKKRAKAFVNVEGNWKKAVAWIKEEDTWKRCI